MRTSVYLIRHGQTVANLQHRYQSWSDSPLTDYGQQQASAVARRLRRIPFNIALLSSVGRTHATAGIVLKEHPRVERHEDDRWSEVNHGRWEGLTYREVLAHFPDEAHTRFAAGAQGKAQGGESLVEAAERVRLAWDALLRRFLGGRVLVATHATPIQLVLCQIFGLPPEQHWHWRIDLASITCIDVYAGGAIVRVVNEVPGLGEGRRQKAEGRE